MPTFFRFGAGAFSDSAAAPTVSTNDASTSSQRLRRNYSTTMTHTRFSSASGMNTFQARPIS